MFMYTLVAIMQINPKTNTAVSLISMYLASFSTRCCDHEGFWRMEDAIKDELLNYDLVYRILC